MMNNREPETITISLDEHDVKSLINSVVHQQHLLTQQAQTQAQQQNTQQRQMQQPTQHQHHLTVQQPQLIRQQPQQQQPTISIIPHQVPISVSSTVVPSTSALTTGATTIPVVQSGGSGGRKRKPKLNQKLGQLSLDEYWPTVLEEVKELKQVDAKNQNLPLARIKKIMKLDENAKMIAAEAPLLFAKACEYFIQELTLRAWHHTEENKRRTLQRSDIVTAISRCDQFDFLIDIVPREEIKSATCETTPEYTSSVIKAEANLADMKKASTVVATAGATTSISDPIQYLLQLGSTTNSSVQPVAQIIHSSGTANSNIQAVPLNQQLITSGPPALTPISVMPQNIIINPQAQANLVNTIQQQAAAVNAVQAGSQQTQQTTQPHPVQLYQQIIGPNGEIQTVPISLPQNQLSFIRIQGANTGNSNQQTQPQFIIQQPTGTIQVAASSASTAAQPSTSQGIFVNQSTLQPVLNKGNVNVTNFRTN
ncbi:nuclear transcription factor Y subunit gamma-like [Condylostylus longicornis]|uniref:nuclear transcription factor Y subunit gamma-like n=1 Tax=Condylostylus longicornis TaxID=2530218 RepID=UPI00244E52DC|nr:nuclear transcription factor Y subunit gamma-like [Condylostylus longicornis]